MKKLLLLIVLLSTVAPLIAQKKYALIIGIDKYYDKPGVLSSSSLEGCVNDALAIKGLIKTRFGFKENEITELYNVNATKKNIVNQLDVLLQKVSKDDVVFIYYAGHGTTILNLYSNKFNGHNQGLVTSDMYVKGSPIIRDNHMKRFFNAIIDKKGILTGIFDCCYSGGMMKGPLIRPLERIGRARSIEWYDEEVESDSVESFNTETSNSIGTRRSSNEGPDIKEKFSEPRPEDKVNSRCLFITAATGFQESKETTDISGLKHGVFTNALLNTFKKNNSTVNASKLFKDIQEELRHQFISKEVQEPTIVGDKNRHNKNLFGSETIANTKTVKTNVKAINKSTIILEGGASFGLSKGNMLISSGQRKNTWLKVIAINQNESATAVVIKGDIKAIKINDDFEVKDWYAVSAPKLKLYLPKQHLSLQDYNRLIKELLPAAQKQNFTDYNDYQVRNYTYIYYDNNRFVADKIDQEHKVTKMTFPLKAFSNKKIREISRGGDYFVNLPIPAEVMTILVKKLSTDQNIEFVTDASKADMGLYSALVKGNKGLAFLCSTEFIGTNFSNHIHMGEEKTVFFNKTTIDIKSINKIADDLKGLILLTASANGWLNNRPRRRD